LAQRRLLSMVDCPCRSWYACVLPSRVRVRKQHANLCQNVHRRSPHRATRTAWVPADPVPLRPMDGTSLSSTPRHGRMQEICPSPPGHDTSPSGDPPGELYGFSPTPKILRRFYPPFWPS
jgi:hypothetical protein